MTRELDKSTLDAAAKFYASEFPRDTIWSKKRKPTAIWAGHRKFDKVALAGRDYAMQCLWMATFADEHDYLVEQMKADMGVNTLVDFEAAAKALFTRRDMGDFVNLLKERLAVDPNGNHIEGAIGKVQLGQRVVGRRAIIVRRPIVRPVDPGNPASDFKIVGYREHPAIKRDEWPIYAGEGEERAAGRIKSKIGGRGGGADPLPEGAEPLALGANVTNISAEFGIAVLDTGTLRLDEGSTAATIRGRDGSMPADPDAAESGTLGFTLTCSDPAILGAVDDADGTCSATFDTISDDVSADATITLSYCRFGATGAGVDDHIDGNATTDATGATDWNTLAIVSGATISITSAVLGISQGSTAS